ncbi:MAG: hypothetical protein LUG18_11245 [Candidatus Azobacteroides sp.]|nr:hypothetical protein [Candidatus Azobacteroides sp.]
MKSFFIRNIEILQSVINGKTGLYSLLSGLSYAMVSKSKAHRISYTGPNAFFTDMNQAN